MKIGVVGAGYVGLVTAACFADLGNDVVCMDISEEKIKSLKKGIIPIYEPKLEGIVKDGLREGRLTFTTDIAALVKKTEIIFIAVGTPPKENGDADLSHIEDVSRKIAACMSAYRLIVEKSTVPVHTGKRIEEIITANNKKKIKFDVASNPEFLREGQAIDDFMHPDRIVLGVRTEKAKRTLTDLYSALKAPMVVTDIESAELIKHASNSFLATKISFINSCSNICEKSGANILDVARGMGMDKRIGEKFLNAGAGFGGSCFPKDLDAFISISEKLGYDFGILREVKRVNEEQKILFAKKIKRALGTLKAKTISILGLSFKPDTDDMRCAPSIDIINMLKKDGAKIRAFDPKAMENAKKLINGVIFCNDAYSTVKGADALVIITDWNEFKEMDLAKVKKLMNKPVIIDGRNIYNPDMVKRLGFKYVGVGRL
ncbi:MAG: UDP-glucose/GDP-mannose dehydrogenase family protein [Candidatus Omnitrophica bacterium]|nr:UDP-glucose/GDP-mannose dehydrogenase family protein [Candidatus Omnitrophota bacterium]MBU4487467.1 UDP-glucose/GDP-mannose dehydrogenase family protein [Candidatus Omnitrophota bacterium]MCG2705113.1 UDP-glucose/GDP-mannose dehydrogenase family protein [Candidatus Omnitrophota bacterium]